MKGPVNSTYSNHVWAEYALAMLSTVDVPLFPGCSGRWHWCWVRSTDLRCPHLTITTDQVTPPPVADLLHLDTVFTLPITSDVLETFPVYVLQSLVSIATQTCIALIRPLDDLPESIFLSIWSICHCLFSPLLAALRHPLHHYQQIEWRHEVRLRIDNNINGNHIISRAMRTAAEPRWGSPGGGESTYQWGNMHIVHTHGE